VERVTAENLKPIVEQMVAQDAHVMRDSSTVLAGALRGRKHDQVNHRAEEYVRYEDGVCITTNSIEGFFATLKRGINGVYHHVGKQHLHRYLKRVRFSLQLSQRKGRGSHSVSSQWCEWKTADAAGLKTKLGEKKPNFRITETAKGQLAGWPWQ